jgi:hypothetical protein
MISHHDMAHPQVAEDGMVSNIDGSCENIE